MAVETLFKQGIRKGVRMTHRKAAFQDNSQNTDQQPAKQCKTSNRRPTDITLEIIHTVQQLASV